MVGSRIFVSHTPEAAPLANELVNRVAQYMQPMMTNPSIPKESKQQWLANNNVQWFILVRTKTAIEQTPYNPVYSEVEAALDLYTKGQMQGILAIAADQTEAEDIPPRWSTIRTYNAITLQDRPQAFSSIIKTLGYHAKAPASAALVSGQTQSPVQQNNHAGAQSSGPRGMKRFQRLILPIGIIVVIALIIGAGILVSGLLNTPRGETLISTTPGTSTVLTPANSTTPTPSTAPSQQEVNQANALFKKRTQGSTALTFASTDDNKTSLWDSNFQCALSSDNKTYTVTTLTGQVHLCMATGMNFSQNLAYQATMNIENGGDAGGLVFRSSTHRTVYYRFSLDSQGKYGLILVTQNSTTQASQETVLKGSDTSVKGWNATQPNMLTVIVSNNVIYLYINNTYIDHYDTKNDGVDPSSGQVGVDAISRTAKPTTIIFSDLKVWKF
jgi:hypothetical protein